MPEYHGPILIKTATRGVLAGTTYDARRLSRESDGGRLRAGQQTVAQPVLLTLDAIAEAGTTTPELKAWAAVHHLIAPVAAGSESYTRKIVLPRLATALDATTLEPMTGDTITLRLTFEASANPTIELRENTDEGTLLLTIAGTGAVFTRTVQAVFTGAAWEILAAAADGAPGSAGTNGVNAFTYTADLFLQPAVDATVDVQMVDGSWTALGQYLELEGVGTFQIDAFPPVANLVTLRLRAPMVPEDTEIGVGTKISPGGMPGISGAPGSDGAPGSSGSNGEPGLNPRGAWDADTAYAIRDFISSAGSSYVATTTTTGDVPSTSPSQWQVVALRGITGQPGADGAGFTADTDWTANADAGDKTQVIPQASDIGTIAAALDMVVSGAGTLLLATAEKCKSLETALAAGVRPNE